MTPEEHAAGLGEAYTFVALAMPSRYVVTWKVGKRDQATTDAFIADLRARLVVMPAMTSDGLAAYLSAIGTSFGPGVDYGQTIKNYTKSGRKDDDHRYEPPRVPFITKKAIFGAPDMGRATTAHVERNHGTMRHHIGRMRRLVYAFSKSPGAPRRGRRARATATTTSAGSLRTTRLTPAHRGRRDRPPVGAARAAGRALERARDRHAGEEAARVAQARGARRASCPTGAGSSGSSRAAARPQRLLRPAPAPPAAPPSALRSPRSPARAARPRQPRRRAAASARGPSAPAPSTAADALPGQLDLLSYRPAPRPETGDAPAAPAPPRPASKRLDMTPDQLSLLFGIDLDPEPKK